jgi:hypothetical protein
MQHARGTLTKIYAQAAQHFAGEQAAILAWPLACGAKIARRTSAVSCVNGELAVRVPDRIWRNELECLAAQYLSMLNQVTRQKVKRIRFVAAD